MDTFYRIDPYRATGRFLFGAPIKLLARNSNFK